MDTKHPSTCSRWQLRCLNSPTKEVEKQKLLWQCCGTPACAGCPGPTQQLLWKGPDEASDVHFLPVQQRQTPGSIRPHSRSCRHGLGVLPTAPITRNFPLLPSFLLFLAQGAALFTSKVSWKKQGTKCKEEEEDRSRGCAGQAFLCCLDVMDLRRLLSPAVLPTPPSLTLGHPHSWQSSRHGNQRAALCPRRSPHPQGSNAGLTFLLAKAQPRMLPPRPALRPLP